MKINFKSRLISIILVLAMIIASVPCAFAEETDVATPLSEKYVEAYSLLKTLGIYTSAEVDAMDHNAEITRAEFVKRLIKAMNSEEAVNVVKDKTIFMDIHDKSYTGYINLAHSMGIVNGTGDARFAPNSPVTLQMAVTMIMRALGYGYLRTDYEVQGKAIQLGVLSKIESQENVSCRDAALLLYNTVHKSALSIKGFTDKTQEISPDKTWLELYFNISYVDGIVDATQVTALKRKPAKVDNAISVNGVEIFEATEGTTALLGYPIRCYYVKDDSYNTFKHISSYGFKYKDAEFEASDVESFTTTLLTYRAENKKLKKYEIASSADFIYNGKAESLAKHPLSEMKKGYDTVKLLDNNNDGKYDVVFITNSIIVAVDSVDTARMSIVGKGSEVEKLKDDSTKVLKFLKSSGETASINDIKEWNVLSIIRSFDKEYVEVIISDRSVSGMVDGYYTDELTYVTVDGTEYKIDSSLIKSQKVQLGKAGTFYLSADGVIYAVNYESATDGKWVWAAGIEEGDRRNTYIFGCVEGSQAKFKIYEIAEKIKIDGKSYDEKDLKAVIPAITLPEAMVISVNQNDEIIKINTLTKGANETAAENIYKRHKGPESDTILNNGKLYYNQSTRAMDGKYLISEKALNYGFPTYDTTAYDDMFEIKYSHENRPKYSCTLYSLGNDTPYIDFSIVVNENQSGQVSKDSGFVPFVRLSRKYDSETDTITDVLYYLNEANAEVCVVIPEEIKSIEMYYSDKSFDFDGDGTNDYTGGTDMPVSWILNRLEKGDLIYIGTDMNGLSGIEHVYDVSKRELIRSQGGYYTDGAQPYYGSTRTFTGKLYEVKDNYLRILTDTEDYDEVTGEGMEVHTITAARAIGWNRVMTVDSDGEISLSAVTTPAFPGVKQNCYDYEVVMLAMYGDTVFKLFIDYTDSPY